jgi:hypothetical protein
MEHPAEDLRHDTGPFGTVTSTVFLLPVGRIDSRIPLQEALVWEVASALEAAGYKVMMVEAGVSHAHVDKWPSLRVVIEEFKFRNDSYVYPVIPTRGEVALRMKARDAGGRVVFDQTFRASVASYCSTPFLVTLLTFDCAFANAVNEAMTEVLNSILAAVSSDEFRKVFTPREGQQK